MKKILITGKGSYIGTSFEKYVENYSGFVVNTVETKNGDWKSCDFSGYDVVFHTAGLAHIKETKENSSLYFEVNRDLAFSIAQKAKSQGVRQFVFLSSMSVYSQTSGVITEKSETSPKTSYGKSKIEAEKLIEKLSDDDFFVTILRPPMVYGENCKGNYVTLVKLAKLCPFFPDVSNQKSLIHIDNLCEFVKLVIKNRDKGLFLPQNKEYVKTSEMVKLIGEANGKNVKLTKIFNVFVKMLSPFSGQLSKAFSSLVYDKKLSNYKENYQVVSFEESIEK